MRRMSIYTALAAAAMMTPAHGALSLADENPLGGRIMLRESRRTTKRGKHAARRQGAKLKPNRCIISKRVRRKHRRAA